MESPSADYDYTFDPDAPNNTAATIFELALEGGPTILDVGSGPAIVSSYLAREHGRDVVALDVSASLLEKARAHGVGETHVVDLDGPKRFDPIAGRRFDVIILADVLEHLIDPRSVLDAIRDGGLLNDTGFLIVSIPNAAHESVIAELLSNRFEYRPTGLLDETHIRWFTHRSFDELSQRAGYLVTRTHRTIRSLEQTDQFGRAAAVDSATRRHLAELNPEVQTFQYVMRVEPCASGPRIAQLNQELDQANEKLLVLTSELRVESDERANGEAEKLELNAQIQRASTELAAFEDRLEAEVAQATVVAQTDLARVRDARDEHSRDADLLRETIKERDGEIAELRESQAELARELADAKTAGEQLQLSVDELRQSVDGLRRSVQTERMKAVEQLSTVDKRTADAVAKAVEAERQKNRTHIASLQEQLDAVYASNTWRVGSAAKSLGSNPLRGLKDLRKPAPRPAPSAQPRAKSAPSGNSAMPLTLRNQPQMRSQYERSVAQRTFSSEATKIVFAVWTTDLAEGRGDLYVAAGLGRQLEAIGYEVSYLPRQGWHAVPEDADAVIAMLPMFEPLLSPAGCRRIAWIRNETQAWAERSNLGLYDAVLASSQRSIDELSGLIDAPVSILKIGVDTDLFMPPSFAGAGRRGVVTTVNQWGRERDTYQGLAQSEVDFDLAILGQTREFNPTLLPYATGMKSYFELPSAYQQAALVLDDLNHTTKAYGNVNSRLFEALAAGALVVTNSARGLEELGLGDLPVYDEPGQLNGLIRDLLDRPDECAELASRLSDIVRRDHSFRARAESFDAFWATLPDRPASEVIVGWHTEQSHRESAADRATLAETGVRTVAVPDLANIRAANSALGSGHEFLMFIDVTRDMLRLDGDPLAQLRGRQAVADELDRLRGGNVPIVARVAEDAAEAALSPTELVMRRDVLNRANLVLHDDAEICNSAAAAAGLLRILADQKS